jgi:hypothetical protein
MSTAVAIVLLTGALCGTLYVDYKAFGPCIGLSDQDFVAWTLDLLPDCHPTKSAFRRVCLGLCTDMER